MEMVQISQVNNTKYLIIKIFIAFFFARVTFPFELYLDNIFSGFQPFKMNLTVDSRLLMLIQFKAKAAGCRSSGTQSKSGLLHPLLLSL